MKFHVLFSVSLSTLLCAVSCSGGGGGEAGGNSGLLMEGTLIQGSSVGHAFSGAKHSAGQPIGSVEICASGACSMTDDAGHWGFLMEGEFAGGDVVLTVQGHGIDSSTIVSVPAGAENVQLDLVNNSGVVEAHTVSIDGAEQPHSHEHGE